MAKSSFADQAPRDDLSVGREQALLVGVLPAGTVPAVQAALGG